MGGAKRQEEEPIIIIIMRFDTERKRMRKTCITETNRRDGLFESRPP